VQAVAALRYTSLPVRIGPLSTQVTATITDPAGLGPVLHLTMVSGRAGGLPDGVFADADLARRYGLGVGGSRGAYLHEELRDADQVLRRLYALLALAVVIGILGVVNTLALSVLERTREIGLLRAIGLTRRELRMVIRIESALIAMVGGALGIAGGYLLGAMFQRTALRTGLLEAAVPAGQLLGALAGLAVIALAAAAWPARRAVKTDVLAAVATE
jgi:predicted lysophospholipase L1 biosynthesis ABC-type transport system permease subunit